MWINLGLKFEHSRHYGLDSGMLHVLHKRSALEAIVQAERQPCHLESVVADKPEPSMQLRTPQPTNAFAPEQAARLIAETKITTQHILQTAPRGEKKFYHQPLESLRPEAPAPGRPTPGRGPAHHSAVASREPSGNHSATAASPGRRGAAAASGPAGVGRGRVGSAPA